MENLNIIWIHLSLIGEVFMSGAELTGILYVTGLTLIFIGMILLFLSVLRQRRKIGGEVGGVILIGPIPIIFGTNNRILKVMLILTLILVSLSILTMVLPYL